MQPVACPVILFGGGGSTNSVDSDNGALGAIVLEALYIGKRNFISYSNFFLIFAILDYL